MMTSFKVVLVQEYVNDSCDNNIEAKYMLPLDDMATVCGFEATVNDKKVVAVLKEKQEAHQIYK